MAQLKILRIEMLNSSRFKIFLEKKEHVHTNGEYSGFN